MSLELAMIPQCEQDVFCIPDYEIARVLAESSPLGGHIPKKDDVHHYLQSVNGALIEKQESRSKRYEKYVTATGIYACVQHLVHLDLLPKFASQFTQIVGRKPYRIKKPFEIILTREDAEMQTLEPLFEASLVALEDPVDFEQAPRFIRSEHLKEKLAESARTLVARMHHEKCVHERDRLLFTSLVDVCFPLFGLERHTKTYEYLRMHIRSTYGHFHFKVPFCLAPAREEPE